MANTTQQIRGLGIWSLLTTIGQMIFTLTYYNNIHNQIHLESKGADKTSQCNPIFLYAACSCGLLGSILSVTAAYLHAFCRDTNESLRQEAVARQEPIRFDPIIPIVDSCLQTMLLIVLVAGASNILNIAKPQNCARGFTDLIFLITLITPIIIKAFTARYFNLADNAPQNRCVF